jgi:hypothetical protein
VTPLWVTSLSDYDLETLWTILYLGVDSPGVIPSWSQRGIELLDTLQTEVERRRGAEPNETPPSVPGL